MVDAAPIAFASFEQKWLDANPEQATVALFLAADDRLRAAAWGALVHELEQSVFGLRETQVAQVKLAWWRQELNSASGGSPRHPITAVLLADPRAAAIPAAAWNALGEAAFALLAPGTPSNWHALFSEYAAFYAAAARIEAELFMGGEGESAAGTRLATASHLLTSLRHLSEPTERLTVPLDLCARHELTRGVLTESSARRDALLRDYLGLLGAEIEQALAHAEHAALGRRVRARLDLALARAASRAEKPLAYLLRHVGTLRWTALWWSWREARRSARCA